MLALAIIVAALSLLHLRGILPGQTFLPIDLANNLYPWRSGDFQTLHNALVTDPLFEFYPYLAFAVDTVKTTGQWPLWTPNIFLGHPALADPNFQTFYPFYLALGLAVGAARALAVGPWLHALLAGFLVYGWIRTLGYGRRAALLAALAYAAGGQMLTWFGARQWLGTLTWLPGVLWAFELLLARRRWRYLALAMAFQGLALLSGQYQVWLAFSLFLLAYAGLRTLEQRRAGRRLSGTPVAAAAAIVAVGALLAAIQLLPSIEYLALSHRANARLIATAMDPVQLISLVIPDFFGNPTTVGDYWGQLNYSERTLYAGLVVLLLAILAPVTVRRRRFLAIGLALLTGAVAYFVVGGPGVELLQAIPGFKYLALARSAFLLSLLTAPLAAMTLDERPTSPWPPLLAALLLGALAALAIGANWGGAQEHWEDLRAPVLRAGALLAAAAALLAVRALNARSRRWSEWALIGLVFLDLYGWGHDFNPAGPIDELLPPHAATEFVQANAGGQRTAPLMLGWDLAFGPNILSVFGVAEPGGYSSMVPARLRELFIAGDPQGQHWNILSFQQPALRLLDLLQVGLVASPRPLEDVDVRMEVGPLACTGSSDEITPSRPVSGRFVPQVGAINRFDLKFRRLGEAEGDAALHVRLWQGAGRERLVFEAQQAAADLADQQEVTWYFAPEQTAPGQTYVWEVSAADGAATGVALCLAADGQPAQAVYGQVWTKIFDDGIAYQQRSAPMPRAYVVYAAETVAGDPQAVERLLSPAFDLRNTALVAEPLSLPAAAPRPASRATLVEYQPAKVVVAATAAQPGLLILGDLWHPGWRVTLDGQPAELLRANHVLRGVLLPAGQHHVEFRFQPSSLRNGGLLSLAALGFLLALLLLDRRQQRAGKL